MPVIVLQGVRGGVGTTSVAAGLAWALQLLGETVLAIDFSSDNLLRLHFNTPIAQSSGWARAQADGAPWRQSAMQYVPRLDFLPFGQLNQIEITALQQHCIHAPAFWRDNLAQINAQGRHRWILIDAPADNSPLARQALAAADAVLLLLTPDANCHLRLHQQELPAKRHFLINQFTPTSVLQQDLHQLWLHTLPHLLPLVIHRDEALAESLAAKQPLGEYSSLSVAAEEIVTLANWCLIHLTKEAV
ncbi:cellulose synthase operon protein YhjQ [Brenneria izadpanahii]|uniref:Cellulose synthase operon protein YhjQ n=1 Tax=Brenneria izadpanahii TaxID=2722756 RepID=A0ABX7V095_9GAMM|nr:cellulose biosynthesis protein BcsQ [Brenneria izadpanahii]QTF10456.1 cellulose synthase operon protein YhjQ [Brenneria izadpanahii]